MTLSSAYVLVSHGSRDPNPQIAVNSLAQLVRQQMHQKTKSDRLSHQYELGENLTATTAVMSKPQQHAVGTASLELAPVPLHESIRQFARQAGVKRLQVLPLFLCPGVHVKEDIPAEVALAQQALGRETLVELRPHLGSYPGMKKLLANKFSYSTAEARILLSHGSRRLGSNQPIEDLARSLNCDVAYWSVSPSLTEKIATLAAAGFKEIAILPYFLFRGGITEAIALEVKQLQLAFPQVLLQLGEPIGASRELAALIIDGMEN